MSGFGADLAAAGRGLVNRATSGLRQLRRTTPGPALIRLTAGLAAIAAFALALPGASAGVVTLLAVIGAGVGFSPRTWWVTCVLLLAVAGWLMTTMTLAREPAPVRVALFAGALYLTHSAAALAAVLPYDCLVAPRVLLQWAGRTAGVLGASLAVGVGSLTAANQLSTRSTTMGPAVGVLVAAGLVGLLAWQLRRR